MSPTRAMLLPAILWLAIAPTRALGSDECGGCPDGLQELCHPLADAGGMQLGGFLLTFERPRKKDVVQVCRSKKTAEPKGFKESFALSMALAMRGYCIVRTGTGETSGDCEGRRIVRVTAPAAEAFDEAFLEATSEISGSFSVRRNLITVMVE